MAMKLWIEGATAAGTIAIAALAVWGEKIRGVLSPPKLLLELHTPNGVPVTIKTGTPSMYYHLRVVNKRRWLAVHDCRVLLTKLAKRGPDGFFHEVGLPVPFEYAWAPRESGEHQRRRTIVREQILDFGRILESQPVFVPMLWAWANDFDGIVYKGGAVRYYLEIEGLNFASPRPQVFEVAYDGDWDSPDKMPTHVRLREVSWREIDTKP